MEVEEELDEAGPEELDEETVEESFKDPEPFEMGAAELSLDDEEIVRPPQEARINGADRLRISSVFFMIFPLNKTPEIVTEFFPVTIETFSLGLSKFLPLIIKLTTFPNKSKFIIIFPRSKKVDFHRFHSPLTAATLLVGRPSALSQTLAKNKSRSDDGLKWGCRSSHEKL